MIIKKFLANTEAEALRLMREELGAEAVVVSRRTIRPTGLKAFFAAPKVEITGAVESNKGERKSKGMSQGELNDSLDSLKRFVSEVDSMEGDRVTLSRGARQQLLDSESRVSPSRKAPEPRPKADTPTQMKDFLRLSRSLVDEFRDDPEEPVEEVPAPKEEVEPPKSRDSIRDMIRQEMARAQGSVSVGALEQNDETVVGSVRFLMAKGVARSLALEIEAKLEKEFGSTDMERPNPKRTARMNAMKRELSRLIQTAGPIRLQKGICTAVALVGPHGVGKTTTLTKLAVEYARRLGKRVAIISLDQAKVGAREQIHGLSEKFRIPLTVATSTFEFQQALKEYRDRDLVLIDTSGRSQYDRKRMDELADCLSLVDHLYTYLTLGASTKDIDIYGSIQQYANLTIEGLIVTKLDETIAYGTMVNLCHFTGMPIAYLCVGPNVPDDLKVADADDIARTLMVHHNNQEYQSLRQLVAH